MGSPPGFIDAVVRARDLVVTRSTAHAWRLEPTAAASAWYVDLDDGTTTADDKDPATSISWVCPSLRVVHPSGAPGAVHLDVRRPGPHSDLGRFLARVGRLAGRASPRAGGGAGRFVYTDPQGVVDASLRERIEHWPTDPDGDGVAQPAELWSIRITGEGLVVLSVSWWGSAAALDHQIALGVDLADRLSPLRR